MILCVGVADYLTGPDISLILFYLAPIGFGTWYVSLRAGLFLSTAAALASLAALLVLAWTAHTEAAGVLAFIK